MKRIFFLLVTVILLCLAFSALAADPVQIESITLSETELDIQTLKTVTVRAAVSPASAGGKNLVWISSDENVATVRSGRVTGVGSGTATITVYSTDGGGASASLQVHVTSMVQHIIPDPKRVVLPPGANWSLFWTVEPADADNKNVTWASNNTRIATVDQNGVVSAHATGYCTVTCTAADGSGARGSFSIVVKPHDILILEPGDVDVEFETEEDSVNITVNKNGKREAQATQRRFRTDNRCISSPENMVLHPLKPGSDIIRIEYIQKKKALKTETYTVYVSQAAMGESVRLDEDGEPEPIRFLDIPWGSACPTVNEYLQKRDMSLKPLSQRNDYLRAMVDKEILFGNLWAYSAATNYTYTVGDRLWEVRNGLFRGDLYFYPEIPFDSVLQAARSIYSLGEGQKVGDRDYAWQRGHVSVTLTWTKHYTVLELIWDGTEEEAPEEPEEAEDMEEADDEDFDDGE